MGKSWRSMLGLRPDPKDKIEVPLSPLLTGEVAIPGVPTSAYPWDMPLGRFPQDTQGNSLNAPMLEYFAHAEDDNGHLAYLPAYILQRFSSMPREMIHALYYPMSLDPQGADQNYCMVTGHYVKLLMGEFGGSYGGVPIGFQAERRAIQGAEEMLRILAPLFFMDAEELSQALGHKHGVSFYDTLNEGGTPLAQLYDKLLLALEEMTWLLFSLNDFSSLCYAMSVKILFNMWQDLDRGDHPGYRVDDYLMDIFQERVLKSVGYLDFATEKYSPTMTLGSGWDTPFLSGNLIIDFLEEFYRSDYGVIQGLLNDLSKEMTRDNGAVANWLWVHLPLLNRGKILELANMTKEYNLEWALAAIDMDDGYVVSTERELEVMAP